MSRNEIKAFESACQIDHRRDGYYVKHEHADTFVGPYKSAFDALRYYRLIWCVE